MELKIFEPKHKAAYYLYQAILVLTAILLVYGCVSTSKVLEVSKNSTSAPNVIHPAYKDVWGALKALQTDMEALQQFTPDYEISRFSKGLQYIKDGKNEEAEVLFKTLSDTAYNELIREHSGKIYSNLLFNTGKFQELYKYSQNYTIDNSNESNDLIIVNAFRQSPVETYRFPEVPIILPLSVSKSGSPVIKVKVNGKSFNFWIDSGAGISVLSSEVAATCGIQPKGAETTTAGTGTNKRVTIQPAIIDSLEIGGLLIYNHPSIIIDKSDLEIKLFGLFTVVKIDGIIGWNAIKNMRLEIDYALNEVTIKEPRQQENLTRNFFWLGYPMVELLSESGIPVLFGLDTGARNSSVTDHLLGKFEIMPTSTKQETVGSAGGFEKMEVKTLPGLTLLLGNYRLQFSNIQTRPPVNTIFISPDGVLGIDIAKDARLIIDYKNSYFGYEVNHY